MRLEFLSIEISHFKSFAETQTLEFAKYGPGCIFVRGRNEVEPRLGSNGAAKSSLWGALCWCLYGRTPEGLRNPDIKPWGSNKTPTVTLQLKVDDESHTITRTAVTNGLKIDGQEVGGEEAAKLIGLEFDVFVNTILLPQGLPLFFDRSPKDKMQLFTDVLKLERWEDRSATASTKARELEHLEAEMTGELTGTEAACNQTTEMLRRTRTLSTEWEEARQKRLQEFERSVTEQEAVLKVQQASLDRYDLVYDKASTELKALRKELPKLTASAASYREEYNAAHYALDTKEKELHKLERELETLGEADECPTCGQPIKGTELGKHKRELERQANTLRTTIDSGVSKKLTASYKEAEAMLQRSTTATEGFESEAETALEQLNFLKPQVAELKAQLLALKAGRTERKEEANPYAEQVQTLRRKQAQQELVCKELREDLAKAQQKIERTRFWIKGFRDVQLFIIEEILQELELATNVALVEVGLEDWIVKYGIEKEGKSGNIQRGINATIAPPYDYLQGVASLGEAWRGKARYGKARRGKARQGEEGFDRPSSNFIRWESWSGGEGQRLRIVGALALSEVLLRHAGVECNLEILDEPTRHLSDVGVQDLCDCLGNRANQLEKTIFLIDHKAIESANFAEVITVVKTKQGSKIVES